MNSNNEKFPIPGYDGYFITKDGNVYSTHRNKYIPQELKPNLDGKGYPSVRLMKDGKLNTWKVHKLQELTFLGGPKEGLQIDHIDGDKTNNHIDNLRQVTPYENNHNSITEQRKLDVLASSEYREKLSSIMQEKFKDEEYRERVKQAATKRLNDPNWQDNHAKAMKEVWSRPEMREQIYKNLDKMNNDPEIRAYNAQRSKEVNSRQCKATNVSTGEEIIFNSITDCANYLNINTRTVNRAMRLNIPCQLGWTFVRLDKLKDNE